MKNFIHRKSRYFAYLTREKDENLEEEEELEKIKKKKADHVKLVNDI